MTQIATIILVSLLLLGGYGPSLAAPDVRTEYGWLNLMFKDDTTLEDFIGGYGRGFVIGLNNGVISTPSETAKIIMCLSEREFSPDELKALAVKFLAKRGYLFEQVKPATNADRFLALDKLYWFIIHDACQL